MLFQIEIISSKLNFVNISLIRLDKVIDFSYFVLQNEIVEYANTDLMTCHKSYNKTEAVCYQSEIELSC